MSSSPLSSSTSTPTTPLTPPTPQQQSVVTQVYFHIEATYIATRLIDENDPMLMTPPSSSSSSSSPVIQQQEQESSEESSSTTTNTQLLDTIKRFAIANHYDYDRTLKALERCIKWRIEKRPYAVQKSQVMRELRTQKAYWYGRDRQGHPICVMKPQYHLPSQRDYDECLKFTYYTIEYGIKLMMMTETENGNGGGNGSDNSSSSYCTDGKCVIIYDGSSVGFSNLELAMFKDVIECVQMYPERLLKCFVVKPNWSFSALLTTVTPFLDPVTKSKIVTIKDYGDLFQFIDPSQVQKEYGGTSDYNLLEAIEAEAATTSSL